jgi:pimeloyl-ACP methyl ester carboxylesterase
MQASEARSVDPIPGPSGKHARLRNGIELFYDERGEGPPIVLVMGIGAQMILWPEGLCDMIAARGFRVVRFDNRDVGLSTKLDHLGVPAMPGTFLRAFVGLSVDAPYSLEDMAADTAQLFDVLSIDRAHVVGASMGGMIAQAMGYSQPHRLRSLVSLMSTTGQPGKLVHHPRALRALMGPAPRNREQAIERHVELFRVVRSTAFEYDERAVAERAALSWDRGYHPRGFLRHMGAIGATGDRTSRLRFVKAPTLVIHGTVDPLIRPIGGEMTARAIPGAALRWIEGMGHDLPEGAWPLLTELIVSHAQRSDAAAADRS